MKKLEKVISTRNILERLIFYCRDKGIDISTVADMENGYIAKYNSSPDAEGKWKIENDLFQLISIAEGLEGKEAVRALSGTVGYFAVASMINNPLIQRLLNNLKNNESLVEALSEIYDVPFDSSNPQDMIELAGRLVANSLASEEDVKSKLGRVWDRLGALLSRIGQFIKNVFKKGVSAREIYSMQSAVDSIRR